MVMAASAPAVCEAEAEGDDADAVPVVVDLLQAASARMAAAPRAPAPSQRRPLRWKSCGAYMVSPLRTALVRRRVVRRGREAGFPPGIVSGGGITELPGRPCWAWPRSPPARRATPPPSASPSP